MKDVGSSPGQLGRYIGPRCSRNVLRYKVQDKPLGQPMPLLSSFLAQEQSTFSSLLPIPRLPRPWRCVGRERENAVAKYAGRRNFRIQSTLMERSGRGFLHFFFVEKTSKNPKDGLATIGAVLPDLKSIPIRITFGLTNIYSK